MKIEQKDNALHEAGLLTLDINKVSTQLNWTPKIDAPKAIDLTINWYKNFYKGNIAAELVENDLHYYQSLLN